jgi:putative effector of murein hydrolase LrgA (UPF0299 family)
MIKFSWFFILLYFAGISVAMNISILVGGIIMGIALIFILRTLSIIFNKTFDDEEDEGN